jgi:hypothetical protein
VRYLRGSRQIAQKASISGDFLKQDHTSPSSLENAIALQKFGVGQPVRRKEDDTPVRGKGKYTDDFARHKGREDEGGVRALSS